MFFFTRADRELLLYIAHKVREINERNTHMALDFSKLSAGVAKLQADNATLIGLVEGLLANAPDPTAQATLDAITGSVTDVDSAQLAEIAKVQAASQAGPTGGASGATGTDGSTGATGGDTGPTGAAPAQ